MEEPLVLTRSELAQRLGVNEDYPGHTRKRCGEEVFLKKCREKDPQGFGWKYVGKNTYQQVD